MIDTFVRSAGLTGSRENPEINIRLGAHIYGKPDIIRIVVILRTEHRQFCPLVFPEYLENYICKKQARLLIIPEKIPALPCHRND